MISDRVKCMILGHDYHLDRYMTRDIIIDQCSNCGKKRQDKKTFEYR